FLELPRQEVPTTIPATVLRGGVLDDDPPDPAFRHLQVEEELGLPAALRFADVAALATRAAVALHVDPLGRPGLPSLPPVGRRRRGLLPRPAAHDFLPRVVKPGTLAGPLKLRQQKGGMAPLAEARAPLARLDPLGRGRAAWLGPAVPVKVRSDHFEVLGDQAEG